MNFEDLSMSRTLKQNKTNENARYNYYNYTKGFKHLLSKCEQSFE